MEKEQEMIRCLLKYKNDRKRNLTKDGNKK